MAVVSITDSIYDKLPNLVLGFHGCNQETYENVIHRHEHLKRSENAYDWLGNGIYFWENSYERAMEWAKNKYGSDACVIGAVIDMGHCLNLTDYKSSFYLKVAYDSVKDMCETNGIDLPINKQGKSETDILLRNLDCAVIEMVHYISKQPESEWVPFDSVRGVFLEGNGVYPGSAIVEKTHVQICVVNPNCIKGYFAPIEPVLDYSIP